jgi:hypothetical protein
LLLRWRWPRGGSVDFSGPAEGVANLKAAAESLAQHLLDVSRPERRRSHQPRRNTRGELLAIDHGGLMIERLRAA